MKTLFFLLFLAASTQTAPAQRSAVTVDGAGALASPDAAAFYENNPAPPPVWSAITGKPTTLAGFGLTDGSALTGLNAAALSSGTAAPARLGSGTPSSANFLRGDGSWQTISGGGASLPSTMALLKGNGAGGALAAAAGTDYVLPTDGHFAAARDFQPTQLSGLVLWLRGSDLAGLADGAAIATWKDRSGNGNDATQSTAVNRPTKVTGYDGRAAAKFFYDGNSKEMTLPAGVSIGRQAQSVYLVTRPTNTLQDSVYGGFMLDLGNGLQNGYWCNQGYPQLWNGGGSPHTRATALSQSNYLAHGFRASGSSTVFRINDWKQAAGVNASGTVTGGKLGGAVGTTTYDFGGEIAEALIFSRALSDDEENRLFAYFARPALRWQIVCDGNSLTYGYDSANTFTPPLTQGYPWQMNRLLGDGAKVVNFGVVGQTSAQMQSDAATQIDPLLDNTTFPGGNILLAWELTNSINAGGTGAQAGADLVTYCQARRSAGWRVIVATCLSRGSFNSAQEGYRQAANASVRASWPAFADALVDLDLNTVLGGVGTYSNALYYDGDGVHLTRAGYEVAARAFADGIARLSPTRVSTQQLDLAQAATVLPTASAPATPGSGVTLWVSSSDGKLHAKDAAGADRALW